MNRNAVLALTLAGAATIGVGVFVASKTKTARTILNHNPGAIRKSSAAWLGKVQGSDPDLETFDSDVHGARALLANMRTHYNAGARSLATQVNAWVGQGVAPSIQANYQAAVEKTIYDLYGEQPDPSFTFPWDMQSAATLAYAIALYETGVPYFSIGLFEQAWGTL